VIKIYREKRKTDHKDAKKEVPEPTETNEGAVERPSEIVADAYEALRASPKRSEPESSDSGLIVDLSPSNTIPEDIFSTKEPAVVSKYQSKESFFQSFAEIFIRLIIHYLTRRSREPT
jgi:hypothetical protein